MKGKEKVYDSKFESIIEEIENESKEKKTESKEVKKPIETQDSYFPHLEYLDDEDISISTLPKDVQDMMSEFNEKRSELEQEGNEDAFLNLRNLSSVILEAMVANMDGDDLDEDEDLDEEGEEGLSEEGFSKEEIKEIEKDIEESFDEDEYEDEDEDEDEPLKKKEGIFSSVLGGIFNW
jgi:hypothetical protein